MTFEEGCNKYLEYCRQRNLREGTIKHYRQSDDSFVYRRRHIQYFKMKAIKVDKSHIETYNEQELQLLFKKPIEWGKHQVLRFLL